MGLLLQGEVYVCQLVGQASRVKGMGIGVDMNSST